MSSSDHEPDVRSAGTLMGASSDHERDAELRTSLPIFQKNLPASSSSHGFPMRLDHTEFLLIAACIIVLTLGGCTSVDRVRRCAAVGANHGSHRDAEGSMRFFVRLPDARAVPELNVIVVNAEGLQPLGDT